MDLEREPSTIDFLRDWLFECKIENTSQFDALNNHSEVRGFGWHIAIDNLDLILTNRVDMDILKVSIADPTALNQIKSKILQIESNTIDYLIEHVNDDGWNPWKRSFYWKP